MTACQTTWPRMWLMTDERMGERMWEAIDRLPPKRAGIVFRHHSTGPPNRQALAELVSSICTERGFALAVARDAGLARRVDALLVHNPEGPAGDLPFSRSVHSIGEAEAARAEGAALVFVSPVYATRSHPGQTPLGPVRAIEIALAVGVPAIALGGMDARRFEPLYAKGFHGWAAIDAWLKS